MGNGDACTGCLKCSSVIGTVFLVLLNTVFLLLGVAILVVGILLKTDDDVSDNDVLNFLDNVVFGNFSLKNILQILFIVVIVVGAFTILTAVIGGLGACFKVRCLLVFYALIVILCIGIEAVILYFWISLFFGVTDTLQGEFLELMKKYKGAHSRDVISLGWNLVFILFQCCGVSPASATQNDFRTSQWWTTRGTDEIPAACCNDVTKDNYVNYTNIDCTQNWKGYHTSGCEDEFYDFFTGLGEAAIPIIGVTILIEVIAVVFSFLMCCAEQKKSKGQLV